MVSKEKARATGQATIRFCCQMVCGGFAAVVTIVLLKGQSSVRLDSTRLMNSWQGLSEQDVDAKVLSQQHYIPVETNQSTSRVANEVLPVSGKISANSNQPIDEVFHKTNITQTSDNLQQPQHEADGETSESISNENHHEQAQEDLEEAPPLDQRPNKESSSRRRQSTEGAHPPMLSMLDGSASVPLSAMRSPFDPLQVSADALQQKFGKPLMLVKGPPWELDIDMEKCHGHLKPEGTGKVIQDWKIMSVEESLDWLIQTGGSVARFGDSEYSLTVKHSGSLVHGMQTMTPRMQHKMQQVARLGGGTLEKKKNKAAHGGDGNHPPYCIGQMPLYDKGQFDKMNAKNKAFFRGWLQASNKQWHDFFPPGHYCSTSITRPDHRPDLKHAYFVEQWQKVFNGRTVIFAGPTVNHKFPGGWRLSPIGIFRCAKSVVHVPVPRRQAFADVDAILGRILAAWLYEERRTGLIPIVGLMIGPTATILAGELPCIGVPAIDIGHMNPFEKYEGSTVCEGRQVPITHPPAGWKDPYA
eukprot:gnl/MRDRNA2_/MRDRNA2_33644_c0_seq1.p1 gnl/MRDRNA2_/MRDRNA2_33644_c0~~gnl/MRDRNA2_/MRDRNA2_33644_c0_seq1.p1  ORF type:complete len:528 (+),score=89.20 gnl/MRDRNA2_/MRDRNA2_33644_c0_seq1:106-1689(+)